jgi:hypothetical protein
MRSLFLVLLLVGTAHGFLGTISNLVGSIGNTIQSVTNQIGQTASNLINGATNQVNNVIGNVIDSAGNIHGQLVSTANGIQFASNFLWDNVFGPAYDMLIEGIFIINFFYEEIDLVFLLGGQLFLDDKFGNIVSVIGRRRRRSVLPENILSEKYHELTTRFKSNIHQLYEKLFQEERDALIALQKGEINLEDKIRSFYQQMNDIPKQFNQWAEEIQKELESFAATIQGDWVHIVNGYAKNIGITTDTMLKLFQELAQDLMKTLLEVAVKVVPNALTIIENMKQQGLLSFFNH